MILIKQTIDKFGYDPATLKSSSASKVVVACDTCNGVKERRLCDIARKSQYTCRTCCLQKQIKHLARPEYKEKRRQTLLKRFGVAAPGAIPGIQEKIKTSNLAKYGVTHPSKLKKVQVQRVADNMARWGVPHYTQTEDFKHKSKATNIKKYGVEYAMQSKEVQDLYKCKLLEYYGVDNLFKSEEIKTRIKTTNLKKYGAENPAQNKKIHDKIIATNIIRYGFPNPTQNREIYLKALETLQARYGKTSLFSFCGKTQKEINIWLNSLGFDFKPDRKLLNGFELDMYDQDARFAVEYCGLYWHSEAAPKPKNNKYHYNKYKLCKEAGVRLITIFEDEWLYRNSQVRSFLTSALGKNTNKLMARKCQVVLIDNVEAKKHIDLWHIQGATNTIKVAAALVYNNEIVAIMSFGRHPRDNNVTVLDRLCFKPNTSIAGGASKLFQFLLEESKLEKISSWSDNRWSYGNIYSNLNFKLVKELKPDYSYYDKTRNIRVSKQSQKKDNTGCPASMTESTWCRNHDLYRIWDCGKIRWEYTKLNQS